MILNNSKSVKSSIDSKFDIIEKCYKDFISLTDVDAEPENIVHKLVVLNKVSKLYDDLIKKYIKAYDHYDQTIFMNTENSNGNESNKFIDQFTDKYNLKTPNNKNIGLVSLSIYCT